ncbi:YqeG family HAD IIIA-type phosphatase [Ruminococcaceae bacterium OttesenSCG-928-N02]|nr:YqeG family HAD IIIA-type phosphatase [Ruminococcaceae bacterium OttesenSCG-928-N02]
MSLFKPACVFSNITKITPEYLRAQGIKALVLDIDNTLTAHGSQQLAPDIAAWLQTMRDEGFALTVSSNNVKKRVQPFAQRIGLAFVAFSCKPLPFGLARARRRLGSTKRETALVGDQLFTDVLGARLYGIVPLLVEPMYEDTKPTIRLKRALESPLLSRYYKSGGQRIG